MKSGFPFSQKRCTTAPAINRVFLQTKGVAAVASLQSKSDPFKFEWGEEEVWPTSDDATAPNKTKKSYSNTEAKYLATMHKTSSRKPKNQVYIIPHIGKGSCSLGGVAHWLTMK